MSLRQRKHAEHRNIAMGNIGAIHVDTQRGLERRQSQFARTQSAHERMCAAGLDQIATAHDNARLCCTEQFIARARHQIEPCRDRSRRGLLTAAHQDVIRQKRARTLVLIEQQTMLVGQGGKLPRAHFLVKALDAIVGRMNLQDHGRIGRNGLLIICQVRAVGGSDLDELGARSLHYIGDAEAAADLDKLAAADDDLLACGMGRQHQQHSGGVVVNDQRVLGTGKRADQLRGMFLARPTRAGVHTVLERAVAARDLGHGLGGRFRERGATQVGMDNHTRGVDGGTQARQRGAMRTPLDGRGQLALRARSGTGTNRGALLIELGRHGSMDHRVAGLPRRLHHRPLGKQLVDGRNGAQAGAYLIGHVLAIAHVRPFKRNVDQSNTSAESITRYYPRAPQSFPRERRFPG